MTQFTNTREISDAIQQVAEFGDQLKNLYFNIDTADKKVISKLEEKYSETKMDIVDFLKNSAQYDMFKISLDAKHALFFKQVQEGHFNNEIGLNQELKDKIYRDFFQKFNSTPPEDLMTIQEKRNLQMLQQNQSGQKADGIGTFLNESKFLLTVYSRTRCFEGNWEYVKHNLPGQDLLDRDAKNLLQIVSQNPHFLKDHPNHFLKNKGEYRNQAPVVADIFSVIHASSLGSPEAKDKIKQYEKMFKGFAEKKPGITRNFKCQREIKTKEWLRYWDR